MTIFGIGAEDTSRRDNRLFAKTSGRTARLFNSDQLCLKSSVNWIPSRKQHFIARNRKILANFPLSIPALSAISATGSPAGSPAKMSATFASTAKRMQAGSYCTNVCLELVYQYNGLINTKYPVGKVRYCSRLAEYVQVGPMLRTTAHKLLLRRAKHS